MIDFESNLSTDVRESWLSNVANNRTSVAAANKKGSFIDFLATYSFNVPLIAKRVDLLEALLAKFKDEGCLDLATPDYIAILISTCQIHEFGQLSGYVSELLAAFYGSKSSSKFLDYVITSDWGKFMLLRQESRESIVRSIIDSCAYKNSDELAALILKIACTAEGRATIGRAVGGDRFQDIYLDLISATVGRTGGLLRNVAFLTRRELSQPAGAADFPLTKLVTFLSSHRFNAVTRFAIVSLTSRCFRVEISRLIAALGQIDPAAKKLCLMTVGPPFLVWSLIQREFLPITANRYPPTAINQKSLSDFYGALVTRSPAQNSSEESVGVILTTYNPDLGLFRHSLTSILNQSHKLVRVCIIDDCSEFAVFESLKRVIAEVGDGRITLARNDTNIGQYCSRNKALSLLSGVCYFAIQDDDDFSHPDRLKLQIAALRTNRSAMLVMCKQVRFTPNMRYVPDKIDPSQFDPSPASSLFRRELVDEIGGFPNVRSRGDVEFLTRIRRKYGESAVYVVNAAMYLMRCDPETISAAKDRHLKTQLDVFRKAMTSGVPQSYMSGKQHALFK